jgi:acyl dehydratase
VRVYRVKAINTATASSNKMHDDTVARSYGFTGGLVPGVDVWSYLCHLPAKVWGVEWLAEGGLDARFVAPIYDGEQVTLQADDGVEAFDVTARNPAGQACAIGWATRRIVGPMPDIAAYPQAALPDQPLPAASPEYFEHHPVLGTCHIVWQAGLKSTSDLPLFQETGLAPPGWLLRRANDVLVHNVTLGPWIHVESRVRHLGVVTDGDSVSTRARVADHYERKGHRFVELDVLMLANETRPVLAGRHVAIYQPRRAN